MLKVEIALAQNRAFDPLVKTGFLKKIFKPLNNIVIQSFMIVKLL